MGRDLHWDACWNVRDLGGYATASGSWIRYRRVVRAGNLSRLTASGRDALLGYGVRTVVDLRDPREFASDLDPFHERGPWAGAVAYQNVPLISHTNWEALKDPQRRQRAHALIVELSAANIGRVMSAVADAEGVVVIHCHAGKERTGVVSALLLALAGVPEPLIVQDWMASDRHLQALYDDWARREADPSKRAALRATLRSTPDEIRTPLAVVREQGGVERYLRDAGLSRAQVLSLKRRLLV